ncbi:hypothetical protein E4U34_006230 [Claviceps purpurea]|nr:hypothetical protein E4U34_006230 [Claviceps purpurea]
MASFRKIASLCGGRWVGCVAEGLASISLKAESDKMIKITMTSEQRVGDSGAGRPRIGILEETMFGGPMTMLTKQAIGPPSRFMLGTKTPVADSWAQDSKQLNKAAQAAAENSKWCIP